ncbi:dienelactone hydrolase family protein [Gloeobacter violaceus]|uniref:Glr3401 protein n=1 Tax=Gloeobacter violaceus (strain ATCC 29082 / PCC 7421) TaxID=251221 RepID=Q7NFX3_GLOVI|nr:dienelactone hydrolase family protein [Gloeobacter violaceus]BAC91342.1 glr3401 [Gloeobacter violaceus PCC 7421]
MDSDLLSLLPRVEAIDRRTFIVTTLAAGFALAVLPVGAATINTDTTGLTAGEVKIPVKDGEIPAYRAMPATGNNLPVVLVVQEIFGVHEHIKDVCRRFAKLGYFAIAPELYARQGDVSKIQEVQKVIEVVNKVPDAQVLSDLDAAVAYAAGTGRVNAEKLAVTGFCWGGRITWLYAAHNPKIKAGGAWYGRLVGQSSPNTPTYPVDVAPKIKGAVLGLYGGQDQGIPVSTVEQMRKVLKASGNPSEIIIYEQAPHGFHADYRPSYRPEAAQDAWQKLLAWFKKHGVAQQVSG